MSGFRSVGAERPSLFGFRNSSQAPSPTPANDRYAQNMHAGDSKLGFEAGQTDVATGRPGDRTLPTRPTNELAATTDRDASSSVSAPTTTPVGDKTIRVTLGSPEPLRSCAQPTTANGNFASTLSSSQWKAEGSKRCPETVNEKEAVPTPIQVAAKSRSGTALAPKANTPPRTAEVLDTKAILAQAEARLNGMNTYQVKISRIERVGGQLQPEEDILLSVQRRSQSGSPGMGGRSQQGP